MLFLLITGILFFILSFDLFVLGAELILFSLCCDLLFVCLIEFTLEFGAFFSQGFYLVADVLELSS